MKIVNKKEEIELRKIEEGEAFIFNDTLYMKVERWIFEPKAKINFAYSSVLNLESNTLYVIRCDKVVQPVEAEIRIL